MPPRTCDISRIDGWLQALMAPRFACDVILLGFPGRVRMPEGWTTAHQSLPDHLFYFVAEGSFAARVNQRELRVDAGGLVWVPAGAPFHFWLPPEGSVLIHRFRLRAGGIKTAQKSRIECCVFPAAWLCRKWIEELIDESIHSASNRGERMRGLLLCFFTELARLATVGNRPSGFLSPAQQEKLLQYIVAHVHQRLQPAELAAQLRLSADYFTRLFRRTFHQPPRRWIVEQRIRMAALRLVESQLNVSEVAEEFGYTNLFMFSRQFKEVLGVSPLHYRLEQEVRGICP